jgi:hypothetical protein
MASPSADPVSHFDSHNRFSVMEKIAFFHLFLYFFSLMSLQGGGGALQERRALLLPSGGRQSK